MMPLQQAALAAVQCEKRSKVPAALLVAQWGIESSWGKHAPSNNCFGIKQYSGCYDRQLLDTKEWFTDAELQAFLAADPARTAAPTGNRNTKRVEYKVKDWFASFPSLAACFDRRAEMFFTGRYKPFALQFLQDGDLEKLVRGIAPIYATDPGYASLVLKIAGQENVKRAISEVKSTT